MLPNERISLIAFMTMKFSRNLTLMITLLAAAGRACASAQTGEVQVDEFGLPLASAPQDTADAARWRPAERWKRELADVDREGREDMPAGEAFGIARDDDSYARFGAAFTEAKVPDCLREDGLKRQPPRILFFGFQGVLAFPFVALAKIRGKCL